MSSSAAPTGAGNTYIWERGNGLVFRWRLSTAVAAWLRRLGRNAAGIQHRERPVPLEEIEADDLMHGPPHDLTGF